jgi:dGTPase
LIGKFSSVAAQESNPKWSDLIKREHKLYMRRDDPRGDFARDFNRILHCTAYRRLKHKTQVFFATENDHICTRMEHVSHVQSISYTIGKYLGLNTELTNAIAIGHDLGHAPFGHEGEKILNEIANEKCGDNFWHERNSLWFADNIETLANPMNKQKNLELTYAVRDGIISHCGEVDEKPIRPRDDAINLYKISAPNKVQPFTWEACVVKYADKIAFLGRDIEDAVTLGIISPSKFTTVSNRFQHLIGYTFRSQREEINNTALIHSFILDLCKSSSPKSGIRLSPERLELMKELRDFSDKEIYKHPRLGYYMKFSRLVLHSIFDVLSPCYDASNTLEAIDSNLKPYSELRDDFRDWTIKYTDIGKEMKTEKGYQNRVVYKMNKKENYLRSVLDFIAGMTDRYALRVFDELTRFL